MRLIPFLICLLWAGASYGQWNTNIWPSSKTYFDGRKRSIQVYSALVERATATATATNQIEFPGFFTQRHSLTNYKHYVKNSLITKFVDSSITNAAGNFYSSNDLTAVSMWTVTGLLADVGAPTNYLDVTPWFQLNTVSNGWLFMEPICSRLKWTTTPPYVYIASQKVSCIDNEPVFADAVCADEFVKMTNGWATNSWTSINYGAGRASTNYTALGRGLYFQETPPGYDRYWFSLERQKVKFSASNLTEDIWHSVDVLGYRDFTIDLGCVGNFNSTSNLDAVPLLLYEFTVDHSVSASSNAALVTEWWGSGAETSPYDILGQPDCDDLTASLVGGGTIYDHPALIVRWDVTNGFKFVHIDGIAP